MSTSRIDDARATHVEIAGGEIAVTLVDGRRIVAPLDWFPRLQGANDAERRNWELLGDGEGIRWPELDEDISVAGLLRGTPAPGSTREIES